MRRGFLQVVSILVLLLASAAFGGSPAGAYPVSTQAQLTVDTTNPYVGDTIKIGGFNFHPNESVRLTIAGRYVGTAHTDAVGAFDPPAVVPNLPGPRTVTGTGASGAADDIASLTITIRTRAGVDGTVTTPQAGGLSYTGTEIAGAVTLGLLLIVAGFGIVRAARGRSRRVA